MNPEARRTAILEAALRAAQRHGWARLTRDHIAAEAGVSPGLVSIRFGSMGAAKQAVRDLAARRRVDLANDPAALGEWEWFHGYVAPTTRYRLLVTGDIGVDELARMIEQLEGQRAALMAGSK